MVTPLRIGALFAGYGGLDLAVESVIESEVAWVSEFDAHPSRILAHRYPHAPNLGDVTRIDWSAVEPVDVITGGSPCQDLSHAGKRAGMKSGTRSGLWASMCDAIDIIRPRLVLWENVRGALSAEATAGDVESCEFCVGGDGEPPLRALGRVLGDLAELGYDAAWTGLRAADVGAPHGRWRVFVLAWPAADATGAGSGDALRTRGLPREPRRVGGASLGGLSELSDESSSDTARSGVDLLAAPRATDSTKGGPRQRGASGDLMLPSAVQLLPTPAVNDMGAAYTPETWDAWTDRMRSEHGNGNGHGKSLHIEALRLLKTPTSQLAVNGGSQHPDKRKAGGHGPTLADEVEHLLPTPMAQDSSGAMEDRRAVSGHGAALRDLPYLLPTPCATDGTKGGPNQRGSSGDLMLPSAVTLLPTPTVADTRSGEHMRQANNFDDGGHHGVSLHHLAYHADGERWGDYAPAIARWEVILGRPAPAPTEPTGKGGAHRLSARFVEWLMGLPDGWVTDPAIWEGMKLSTARSAQLTALGNGVVPQQAAAALRWLLGVRESVLP